MVRENKRVTIVDIARSLGVSPKAVSFGLNDTGRLSEELRQRIKAKAREMNYRPNLAARRLVTQSSYLVGALLPYTRASFVGQILDRLEEVTQREEIGLLLGNGGKDPEGVRRGIRQVFEYGVSGLVIMPTYENNQVYIECLSNVDFPVVQLMNPLSEIGGNYVEVNNIMASAQAVQYLLELGHRRIGFISHNSQDISMKHRDAGYRMAMAGAGISVNPKWVEDVTSEFENGYRAAHVLLERAPEITAVFCASDFAALGAIRAVLERNLRIPDDLSVVGFDDMDFAQYQVGMPLTTMAQPKDQIGLMAAELLLDLLHGKPGKGISLNGELKIRATTGICPERKR